MARKAREAPRPSPLGNYIRAKREDAGLSQEKLAEMAGCSHSYISQLETKTPYQLRRQLIPKLAAALGVPMDILLQLDGMKQMLPGAPNIEQQELIGYVLRMDEEQVSVLRVIARLLLSEAAPTRGQEESEIALTFSSLRVLARERLRTLSAQNTAERLARKIAPLQGDEAIPQ